MNNNVRKPSHKPSYTQRFPWLYELNNGGFCQVCRGYWKPRPPVLRDMEQKTKGVFISTPLTN